MNEPKKITGNLFYLLLGGAIATLLEFFTEVTLARRLSDEGYGRWAYVQSIIIYLIIIMDTGLAVYGAREIARFRERAGELIINILAIKSLLMLLIITIFAVIIIMLDFTPEMKIVYIGGSLLLVSQALNPEFIFQGYEKMAGIALWRILNFLFYFTFVYILVKDRSSLVAVPFYKAGGGIISLVILWLILKHIIALPKKTALNIGLWTGYLKVSVIMALSFVIINVYHTFDTIMLGIMMTPEVVGWYNAAYKVILQFVGLAIVAQVVFGPVFSRLRDNAYKLSATLNNFTLLLIFSAGLFCGLLFLMSDQVILLLFKVTYTNAIGILRLLSISLFFVFIHFIFTTPLLYCGYEKAYLACVFSGAFVNIGLNYLFIPHFGYTGAAVATIISNVVIGVMGIYFLKSRMLISNHVYKTIAYITIITTVLTAGLWFGKLSFPVAGIVYTVLFITIIVLLYGDLLWNLLQNLFIKSRRCTGQVEG
ncbi:MAG TPA: flippase [bacterium]|nr:flippase [bacterium]HPN45230.1 flippase [bacterium]